MTVCAVPKLLVVKVSFSGLLVTAPVSPLVTVTVTLAEGLAVSFAV